MGFPTRNKDATITICLKIFDLILFIQLDMMQVTIELPIKFHNYIHVWRCNNWKIFGKSCTMLCGYKFDLSLSNPCKPSVQSSYRFKNMHLPGIINWKRKWELNSFSLHCTSLNWQLKTTERKVKMQRKYDLSQWRRELWGVHQNSSREARAKFPNGHGF